MSSFQPYENLSIDVWWHKPDYARVHHILSSFNKETGHDGLGMVWYTKDRQSGTVKCIFSLTVLKSLSALQQKSKMVSVSHQPQNWKVSSHSGSLYNATKISQGPHRFFVTATKAQWTHSSAKHSQTK